MDSLLFGEYVKKIGLSYEYIGNIIASLNLNALDLKKSFEDGSIWNNILFEKPIHRNVIEEIYNKLPLDQTLQSESMRVSTSVTVSAPATTPPFPKNGISLEAIDNFIKLCGGDENFNGFTTTTVNEEVIKPLTFYAKSSFCDLAVARGECGIGPPTAFISHAWKYQFLDVLNAIRYYFRDKDRKDIIIWFDLFTNNQHLAVELDFNWWCTTFKTAIKDIGKTVIILAPWSDPIPFTRSWCLYEIYCSIATYCELEVAMCESEELNFVNTASNNLSKVNEMIGNIRIQESCAANPLDRERIMQVIKDTVGYDKINTLIFKRLRLWIISSVEHAVYVEMCCKQKANLVLTLGLLHMENGDFENAKKYMEDALVDHNEIFGTNKEETANALHNLGVIKEKLGDYDGALSMFEKALEIYENLYGKDSKRYIGTLQSTGIINMRQPELALPIFRTCYQFYEKELGPDDITTISCKGNIGIALDSLNQSQEALEIFEYCVRKLIDIFGEHHPDTLRWLNSVAAAQVNLEMLDTAAITYLKVVDAKKIVFGSDHPSTMLTILFLAKLYQRLRRYDEADDLFKVCHEWHCSTYGLYHQKTRSCIYSHALNCLSRLAYVEALKLCQILISTESTLENVLGYAGIFEEANRRQNVHNLVVNVSNIVTLENHPHPLEKKLSTHGYSCDICSRSFYPGEWTFRCDSCDFDVDPYHVCEKLKV